MSTITLGQQRDQARDQQQSQQQSQQQRWQKPDRLSLPFLEGAVILIIVFFLWLLWLGTARPVTVTVDGMTTTVRTQRQTVAALLMDAGLDLQAGVDVSVPLASRPTRGMDIRVRRALPVIVAADGRTLQLQSLGATIGDVLMDAGVNADRYDQIVRNGRNVELTAPVMTPVMTEPTARDSLPLPTYSQGYPWATSYREPVVLRIHRAVPIRIQDDGLSVSLRTTAATVGEALREAKILLYLGDDIQPELSSPISTGLRIFIERSTPLSLAVDGRFVKTRTRATSVGGALTQMGIGVSGLDVVEPPLDAALYENVAIQITRVREDIEIEEDIAPFETVFEPDRNILIDTQQVIHPGAEGITRRRYRVRYEDGQEVNRVLEDTWVAQEPATRVIAFGQNIVPNTITTPDGQQITYWRQIRMLATSYSAGTAGVATDSPWFGRTYSGEPMRKGVVAVDPQVIPLRSRVYVPSYGYGDALDMGSAILARRIDLGFDDHNLELWNRWVDVYLLWPPPPDYQITWVLPNWPRPQ